MRAYGDAPPRRHRKVCIRVREEKAELAGEAHLPHALWGRHGCSRGHGEEDGHEQIALRSQPRLPAGREHSAKRSRAARRCASSNGAPFSSSYARCMICEGCKGGDLQLRPVVCPFSE